MPMDVEVGLQADAVIVDPESQPPMVSRGADDEMARLGLTRRAVAERVLYERLQDQRWNAEVEASGVNLVTHIESIAKARLLKVHVTLQPFDLG